MTQTVQIMIRIQAMKFQANQTIPKQISQEKTVRIMIRILAMEIQATKTIIQTLIIQEKTVRKMI